MLDTKISISKEIQLVNDAIRDSVDCGIDVIEKVGHHVIDAGGKRIRPMVLLTAYKALNGENIEKTIQLAAALELIHTGTLIHDDINDRSELRRGNPTAYKKFGTTDALLTGDYFFIKSLDIVRNYDKEIIDTIIDACIIMAEGEVVQSMRKTDINLTEEEYLNIVEKKTASPISASATTGGILAGGTAHQIRCLGDYGLNLGIGFQITDDVLDVIGIETRTGKVIGNDLREGKITILSIHTIKHAATSHKEKLKETLAKKDNTTEEILEAIDIIKDAGSVDYARNLSREYGEKAKAAVEDIPDHAGKEELTLIADFAVNRNL
jgi:octaprenyl-diphosphate synthase